MSERPRYQAIFTDFDYDYIELGNQLGNNWVDTTWRNNTCPSYGFKIVTPFNETWYTVWFDYNDPTKSEFESHRIKGEMKKFELTNDIGDYLFQTDNWEEMLQFIQSKGVQNHYDNEAEKQATDTDG